jgi:hypothetical protein
MGLKSLLGIGSSRKTEDPHLQNFLSDGEKGGAAR